LTGDNLLADLAVFADLTSLTALGILPTPHQGEGRETGGCDDNNFHVGDHIEIKLVYQLTSTEFY